MTHQAQNPAFRQASRGKPPTAGRRPGRSIPGRGWPTAPGFIFTSSHRALRRTRRAAPSLAPLDSCRGGCRRQAEFRLPPRTQEGASLHGWRRPVRQSCQAVYAVGLEVARRGGACCQTQRVDWCGDGDDAVPRPRAGGRSRAAPLVLSAESDWVHLRVRLPGPGAAGALTARSPSGKRRKKARPQRWAPQVRPNRFAGDPPRRRSHRSQPLVGDSPCPLALPAMAARGGTSGGRGNRAELAPGAAGKVTLQIRAGMLPGQPDGSRNADTRRRARASEGKSV